MIIANMKFVSVRDLRGKTSELWKDLERERELVVTNNGKPIAILSATSEESFEESLWALRRMRAHDALARLQSDAQRRGLDTVSDADVEREIEASRRRRDRG